MKNKILSCLALALGALSVGCSSSGDITDLRSKLVKPTLGQQQGLISGSMQSFSSPSGYKVSASVGSWVSGIEQKVQGYTVYSGIQGNINSETSETIISE